MCYFDYGTFSIPVHKRAVILPSGSILYWTNEIMRIICYE